MKLYTIKVLLDLWIYRFPVTSACMRIKILKKKYQQNKKLTHTFDTRYALENPFRRKTQLEGEATSLTFSEWKYGYEYKELRLVAHGLLQYIIPLSVLYLLSLLAFFSQLWNKSKEWNPFSSEWPSYNTIRQSTSDQV